MAEFVDPLADVVLELQRAAIKELEAGEFTDPAPEEAEEVTEAPYKKFLTKIKPTWTKEDQNAIAQLRAAADEAVSDIFGDVLSSLDALYLKIRVPKTRSGNPLRDADGRIVWETDEHGQPLEDWDQLTGTDIEKCLLDLHKTKFVAAKQTNDLFLEALFSKMTAKDAWHEGYEKVLQGTTGDREAAANRAYKTEKYQSFFRYYVWSTANTLLTELNALCRLLDKTREIRQRAGMY